MKRKTKAQREADERAALLRRVLDICITANGGAMAEDDALMYADAICRVMRAVKELWVEGENQDHLVGHWNVDEYESPAKLTDFLYRNGVRA